MCTATCRNCAIMNKHVELKTWNENWRDKKVEGTRKKRKSVTRSTRGCTAGCVWKAAPLELPAWRVRIKEKRGSYPIQLIIEIIPARTIVGNWYRGTVRRDLAPRISHRTGNRTDNVGSFAARKIWLAVSVHCDTSSFILIHSDSSRKFTQVYEGYDALGRFNGEGTVYPHGRSHWYLMETERRWRETFRDKNSMIFAALVVDERRKISSRKPCAVQMEPWL